MTRGSASPPAPPRTSHHHSGHHPNPLGADPAPELQDSGAALGLTWASAQGSFSPDEMLNPLVSRPLPRPDTSPKDRVSRERSSELGKSLFPLHTITCWNQSLDFKHVFSLFKLLVAQLRLDLCKPFGP